jgi:hypothetical protein
MSHAVLLETLDTGAVWSAARGLARKVAEYKRHLAACDSPRRNDLDSRGALSEEALAAFTKFFLEVCVDQVEFMEGLMQPDALRALHSRAQAPSFKRSRQSSHAMLGRKDSCFRLHTFLTGPGYSVSL